MYDYEGFNAGEYGEIPTKKMPANDNRKWALDVIAEALMEIDPDHTSAQILCNIDINPILKAMVSKPLNELFNYMANKIEKTIKLGELD